MPYALTNAQTVAIINFTFRRTFRFLINLEKKKKKKKKKSQDVRNVVPSSTVVW